MKAEHRKELHTNYLADKLGKMFTQTKSSSMAIWVILGLVVLVVVVYFIWTGRAQDRNTNAWMDYRNTAGGTVEVLQQAANRQKGTSAERAIKLTLSDRAYEDGYEGLFKSPMEAAKSFEEVIKVADELEKSLGNCRELGLRALSAKAKAFESLGKLDDALRCYHEVINRYSKDFIIVGKDGSTLATHPLIKDAQTRIALAEAPDGEFRAFYQKWLDPERMPKIKTVKPPPAERTEPPPAP